MKSTMENTMGTMMIMMIGNIMADMATLASATATSEYFTITTTLADCPPDFRKSFTARDSFRPAGHRECSLFRM
jgi:hypothetical protein